MDNRIFEKRKMKIRASIIGVAVPVLVALFLAVDIFILVFDKRFGWFQPMDFDHRFISIGETK